LFRKPRASLLALAAVAATLLTSLVAGPAHAAVATPFKNFGNRKCVDVQTESNHWVQLWSCNGQSQQNWTRVLLTNGFWRLISQKNGLCLGVDSVFAGAQTATVSCGNNSDWQITFANNFGTGWHQQLELGSTGLCLDLLNNSSANGTPIQLWWCWTANQEDNPAQLWML